MGLIESNRRFSSCSWCLPDSQSTYALGEVNPCSQITIWPWRTALGDNLILEHLRGLRSGQDRIESEWREIGARLTSHEANTAADRRDRAHNREETIRQQSSIDQITARIDRIETRLEIAG